MSTPLFGAAGIDAPLLIFFFYSPSPCVNKIVSPPECADTISYLCLFLGIDFMVFIKLRVLVGRKKKSICSSDVICLTFSSLGVMNGKVKKQMTKLVDGKRSHHEMCVWVAAILFCLFLVNFKSEHKKN